MTGNNRPLFSSDTFQLPIILCPVPRQAAREWMLLFFEPAEILVQRQHWNKRSSVCCDTVHLREERDMMDAPTTPLKWSTKKTNNATSAAAAPGSSSYHLKSPTAHRTPGGGSQHSSNGGARSIKSNGGGNGRMNAVFCDVVVEAVDRNAEGWDLPPGEKLSFRTGRGKVLNNNLQRS